MSLFDREHFETFVGGLRSAHIVQQWGDASVGKIGGKIFAILSSWDGGEDPAISFKCSEVSFRMLPELDHVRPAKYLARAKWVQVGPDAPLSEDDLRAYITEAHRLVGLKLTRTQREQLGLAEA